MGSAKDIFIKPIKAKVANNLVKKMHYSGKVVNNSVLHFGVFYEGKLEGALQFGPSMDKRRVMTVVKGTKWQEFIELNRMAFSDKLPRNSESRAIAYCIRLIKKNYPHIKWVISYSDACQCGDGIIYRASGFVLTGINKNSTIMKLPDGTITANITYKTGKHVLKTGGAKNPEGAKTLQGYQLRYIYFIDRSYRERLTVPIIPFSRINEMGIGMYKGQKRVKQATGECPSSSGGATPTYSLQSTGAS